ncbi:hypothetical protein BFW87_19105 [Pseudomonas fluorescens]|uniref:DUF4435 domain-containing protein n=1 Tax=Pseudomonas fluorescens TaxID=294 RepID=A0A1T2YHX3_PSEFL|nr:DUF4435 domain-containing protein [Pseudomonas fluorescens]OPA91731.1 hypothetical protein BFW87_19105 [Pseudomonas fluorescens]
MSEWDKNVGVLVAEIKMMEASYKGFYWLVEGPSDIRFFSTRKRENVELVVAGGKKNVVGAILALSTEPVNSRILGIVDADIDWLIPGYVRPDNVITTDPRDLEGVLLRSGAYFKVLAEFADPSKVNAFEARHKCTVLDYVRNISMFFGRIRAVNDLNFCVSLKKYKPQTFMHKGAWIYDFEWALKVAIEKGVCDTVEELKQKMESLPEVDIWNYVRGHDAVNIFAGGLLAELNRGTKVDSDRVELVLRSGIDEAEYSQTKLHKMIDAWHTSKALAVN